jgi:glycosyltransferase involved in cell wall biosynthesis
MNQMLRILLFSPQGSGSHYFGPGMSAYRMYNLLDDKSVSVSLAHGFRAQKKVDFFDQQYFISDIKKKGIYSGIKFLIEAKKWIKKNAHQFDVVHCLSAFHHSFMMAIWFEKMGVPVVIKITGSKGMGFIENSYKSKLLGLRRYRKKNANNITGYISISSEIRQKLIYAGIELERIFNIPNGVDTDRFKPVDDLSKGKLRDNLGIDNKFTVIFTGSFDENKNPYLISRAFHRFSTRYDAQLLLIGPDRDGGHQRLKINDFIKNNNIANIRVLDFVDDIELYYQASDLFILPSIHEGLSNSLLEAQACGLPAIVTRISGSEDLIDESLNGSFIEPEPGSIANAFEEYKRNSDKLTKYSKCAREIILKKYSCEEVLQKHLLLFSKIRNKRSAIGMN